MKKHHYPAILTTALFATALLAFTLVGCEASDGGAAIVDDGSNLAADGGAAADGASVDGTSEYAKWQLDLIYLREEEKLARDVYLKLYDKWGLMPHKNIAASEQKHTDAVKDVLANNNLPDPVKDDTVGVYKNPEIAKLYNDLVALGGKSEVDALLVGTTIEDLDIYDITQMLDNTTNPTVIAVYKNLRCGSYNHMRAYYGQLKSRGESYKPQYITQVALDAILAGGTTECSGSGGGGGGGGGHGGGGHGGGK